ncbi:ABC transporter [Sphingorhabdus lutea]|uniref:ABC transporter n=1 Tax=Sphingorhabdus lutea TaxID=1913578 RepID=A0A1L3J933_9SPHN|nr:ABC transporter permease [Sphingorhabdus lutea]APG61603.1 ABC transporter [Sphingorhabdus lutea]
MGRLILKRLGTAIPTLLAIIFLSFVMMRLAPGGPFDGERPISDELRQSLNAAYGLDLPIIQQFFLYLGNIAQGDFGPSMVYRDFTVGQLVGQSLPLSLMLGGYALLLSSALGIFSGIASALYAGKLPDKIMMGAATILTALPSFVTGPLLAMIFGLWLGWFPVSGQGEGHLWLILPVISLALPISGAIAKLSRAGLASILPQDHIRAARARGIDEWRIITRHALRPALVPVASYLGPAAAGLLTGAVVIETVFGLPGLGRYFVQGALNRDYPLVLAVVILYAGLIILFNLCADLIYGWLDPRSRQL